MAGYEDTRKKIIETLMGRPMGEEIQPENQQDYALNMLDYVRSLELISTSTLIGIAESDTVPVQPNGSRTCYIAGISQDKTVTFENFIDSSGNAISVTTSEMDGKFAILMWNTQYWSCQTFDTNIISSSESANFYYSYNIRKTYDSLTSMNNDVTNPIGIDGKTIKIGDLVSVVNSSDSSNNGIYTYEKTNWKFQSSYSFEITNKLGTDTNKAVSQALLLKSMTEFNISVLSPTGGIKSDGTSGGDLYDLQSAINELITLVGSSQIKQGVKLIFKDVDDLNRNASYEYGGITWHKKVVDDFGSSKLSTMHQLAITNKFKVAREKSPFIGSVELTENYFYDVTNNRFAESKTVRSSGLLRAGFASHMITTYTGRTNDQSGGVLGFDENRQFIRSIIPGGDIHDYKEYITPDIKFVMVQCRMETHESPPTHQFNCSIQTVDYDMNSYEPIPSGNHMQLLPAALKISNGLVSSSEIRICSPFLRNVAVEVFDGFKILSVFYYSENGEYEGLKVIDNKTFVEFSGRKFRLTFCKDNRLDYISIADNVIKTVITKTDYESNDYQSKLAIEFTQSSLNGANGEVINSDSRIVSNFVRGLIVTNDDYLVLSIHKYQSDGVWLSRTLLSTKTVYIPDDGYLYKIVVSNIDNVSVILPTDNVIKGRLLFTNKQEIDDRLSSITDSLNIIKNGAEETYEFSIGGITVADSSDTTVTNRIRLDGKITNCRVSSKNGVQLAERRYEKDGSYTNTYPVWGTEKILSEEYDWRFIARYTDDRDIDNIHDIIGNIIIEPLSEEPSLKSLDSRLSAIENKTTIKPIIIGKLHSVEPSMRHTIDRTWQYEEFLKNTFDKLPLRKVKIGTTIEYNQESVYDVFAYIYEPVNYKKTVVLTANIHGGERESAYTAAYVLDIIINKAWIHKDIQYIKDNVRFLIVPVSNPYGFNRDVINYQQEGWGWRVYQNNARNCNMNRNWDFGWDNAAVNSSSNDFVGNNRLSEGNANVWNFIKEYYNELSCWFDLHQGLYYGYRYWMVGATQERINPLGQPSLNLLRSIAVSKKDNNSVVQTLSTSCTTAAFATHICCIPGYTLENNSLPGDAAKFIHFSSDSLTNFTEYALNMIHLHVRSDYNPRNTRSTIDYFRSRLLPSPVSCIFGDIYNDSSSDILDRFKEVYESSESLSKISLTEIVHGYLLDKTEDADAEDVIILGALNVGADSKIMYKIQSNATSNKKETRTVTTGIKHVYSILHLLRDIAGDVHIEDTHITQLLRHYRLHFFPVCNYNAIDTNTSSDITSSIKSAVDSYIANLESYSKCISFNEVEVLDANLVIDSEFEGFEKTQKLAEKETLLYNKINELEFVDKSVRINLASLITSGVDYTTDQGTFYASLLVNTILD